MTGMDRYLQTPCCFLDSRFFQQFSAIKFIPRNLENPHTTIRRRTFPRGKNSFKRRCSPPASVLPRFINALTAADCKICTRFPTLPYAFPDILVLAVSSESTNAINFLCCIRASIAGCAVSAIWITARGVTLLASRCRQRLSGEPCCSLGSIRGDPAERDSARPGDIKCTHSGNIFPPDTLARWWHGLPVFRLLFHSRYLLPISNSVFISGAS